MPARTEKPNSLGDDELTQVPDAAGGYVTYPEPFDGPKIRARGESLFDLLDRTIVSVLVDEPLVRAKGVRGAARSPLHPDPATAALRP